MARNAGENRPPLLQQRREVIGVFSTVNGSAKTLLQVRGTAMRRDQVAFSLDLYLLSVNTHLFGSSLKKVRFLNFLS